MAMNRKTMSVGILVCVLLSAVSCTNVVTPPPISADKVLVSIGIQGINGVNSRTVRPTVALSDITGYELWGKVASSSTEERLLFSIVPESIDNSTAVVAVDSGTWNFTLKAYKEGDLVLEGKMQNVDISSYYSSSTPLVFYLTPYIEGQGSVHITITWPLDTGVAGVQVKVGEDGEETSLDILDNSVIYAKGDITAGDYFISFRLIDASGGLLAVVSEILQVRLSLLSEKVIDLEAGDFNAAPNAPGSLNVMVLESTEGTVRFMLEWEDNSYNETGFVLNDGTLDENIEAGRNTHGPLELAVNETITYRIKAVNDFGVSEWTELTYTAEEISGDGLSAPGGIEAEAESSRSINISWNPVEGAQSYNIYRAATADFEVYTRVGTTAAAPYTDTDGLAGNTIYYYRVKASDGVRLGAWSDPVSVLTYPSTPLRVTAELSAGGVTITWDSLSGISTYTLYRSTSSDGNYQEIGTTDAVAYTDTDSALRPSTDYYYRVSASNATGEGERSSPVAVKTSSAPMGVSAVGTSASDIQVLWNTVSDARYYNVYRSTDRNSGYSFVSNIWYQTYYNDSGLSSSTTYYYKVSAVISGTETETDQSSPAEGMTWPSTPSISSVAPSRDGSITITWGEVDRVTGYHVYRSTDDWNYSKIETTADTSYTDTDGLTPSTYYYYKVSAYNEAGEGARSSYSSTGRTYPSVPTGVSAIAASSSSITVSWNSASDASYYHIYRSDAPEGQYTQIYSYHSGTSYTNSSLTAGTTYYYKVSVYNNNSGYEGAQSGYASATTCPPAPSNIRAAVNAGNQIVISWEAVSGATGYTVYRCSSSYYYYDNYYSEIGTTTGSSYTDTTSSSTNTTYYYKVSASNEGGEGNRSDYIDATTHGDTKGISVTITLASDISLDSPTVEILKGQRGTFRVSGSYTSYQWYLDGRPISGASAAEYTLETGSMDAGVYEMTVVVRSNTERFSAGCHVWITN
jgi:fibronectin type 3 domain-containing protein